MRIKSLKIPFGLLLGVFLMFGVGRYAYSTGIGLDNISGESHNNSATTTISFTASANTLIIVAANNADVNGSLVTCTWNGVAMTKDGEKDNTTAGRSVTLWSIYESAGGTHNIVYAAQTASFSSVMVASFTGAANGHALTVNQNAADTATTSLQDTINTAGNNNALHIASSFEDGSAAATGTATFLIQQDSGTGRDNMWSSNPYSVSPAGSNTITVTMSSPTNHWATVAADYAAAAVSTKGGFNDTIQGWWLIFF